MPETDNKKSSQQSLEDSKNALIDSAKSISTLIQPLNPIVDILSRTDFFGEQFRRVIESINKVLSVYDFKEFAESLNRFIANISKSLQRLNTPDLSEVKKQELIQSYKQWGEYGWTINPLEFTTSIFDIMPENQKDANAKALKLCSQNKIEEVFNFLLQEKRLKLSDVKEAVADFRDKRYKSCALILFSLVDAKLIRLQNTKTFKTKKGWRKVGKGAIDRAEERMDDIVDIDKMIITHLFCVNLFSALRKFFENGNDFKQQPLVINRNWLDHGMMTKSVTRKDCVQLFLLYYNVLEFLNLIYDNK